MAAPPSTRAPDAPDEMLHARVAGAMGSAVARWRRPDCGLSSAQRFTVTLADGRTAFVKAATDAPTAAWLRNEHAVLSAVGSDFMPGVMHWDDPAGGHPLLITEQLGGHWPASHAGVHWRPGDLDILFAGIARVSATPAPPGLSALQDPPHSRWRNIGGSPDDFLALGLCSRAWLTSALDPLAEAELAAPFSGTDLVHGDVRSDNVCIEAGRAVFVDWSSAAAGNGEYNLALALPYLRLEGGPLPQDLLPHGAPWAAHLAGDLAERLLAGPSPPPWLRRVLIRLLAIDLAWVAASLRRQPPDGDQAQNLTVIPP